jgi:hypothetical protein
MNEHDSSRTEQKEPLKPPSLYRKGLAFFVFLLGVGYAASTVMGFVKETRKIDSVTLAIIVLAVVAAILLWNPETFTRLRLFQGFGLRLELGDVKQRQDKQESQLRDIDLILPLLFRKTERGYLIDLGQDTGKTYKADHTLRTELRRLRSVGLIKMLPDKHIGQMEDKSNCKLKDYVGLTLLGGHWARKLNEVEKAEKVDEVNDRTVFG